MPFLAISLQSCKKCTELERNDQPPGSAPPVRRRQGPDRPYSSTAASAAAAVAALNDFHRCHTTNTMAATATTAMM